MKQYYTPEELRKRKAKFNEIKQTAREVYLRTVFILKDDDERDLQRLKSTEAFIQAFDIAEHFHRYADIKEKEFLTLTDKV